MSGTELKLCATENLYKMTLDELCTWKTRAEKSEDIVKWIQTMLALNGLEPKQLMDDKYHIQDSMHVLLGAHRDVKKYVECNARIGKEKQALETEHDTLKVELTEMTRLRDYAWANQRLELLNQIDTLKAQSFDNSQTAIENWNLYKDTLLELRIIKARCEKLETRRLAWLIENGKPQGSGLLYLKFDTDAGMFNWTPDVYAALQFSRRQDAEIVATDCEDAWAIIEHSFEVGLNELRKQGEDKT